MENYDNLLLALNESILTITINRESKMNALNLATMHELREAFNYVYDNPKDVRAVILTGAGEKAFVAGADISEFTDFNEMNARKYSSH